MRVILDTNIIFNNYHLNTPRFIGLFRYAKKTKSKVIIPFYVKLEVLKKYKEHLTKYCQEAKQSSKTLFSKDIDLNVEQLLKDYDDAFTKVIKLENIEIPEPNNVNSKDIFNRALFELPPFNNDKGVRDTLIWLSVVDIVNQNPKDDFCFITSNSKDFGAKELFSNLKEDLKENVSRLFYFNSLEEFLSTYGDKIAFIDKNLIDNFLKSNHITPLIEIDHLYDAKIEDIHGGDLDSIDDFSLNSIDIEDFYIYGATETYYKIQADIIAFIDVDVTLIDPYDEFGSRSATTTGSSSCYIQMSLLINKETKEVMIDPDVESVVYYEK